jgi:PEP-CTERM motif
MRKGSYSAGSNSARILAAALFAGGTAIAAFPVTSAAALLPNVVFNDSLASNGSTLDAASQSYSNTATPTATSTNYDVAASKDGTASNFSSGNPLKVIMVSTSSGINEAQAVFTGSPVTLANIGDSVEITATFTDTAGLNQNASSAVYLGLYSSGGSAPYNNLGNGSSSNNTITGLNNTEINDNTGGVQNWLGYEVDYFGGQATKMYSRPAQATTTNNVDQSLVGTGQTGGYTTAGSQASYTSQNSSESTLTIGNQYTDELSITLSAAGVYTLTEALYNGADDTGTQVGTNTVGTLSSLPGGDGFDGMAIGYRESASDASEMDVNQIEVTTNVAVPEPATLALLSVAGIGLMSRRRRHA